MIVNRESLCGKSFKDGVDGEAASSVVLILHITADAAEALTAAGDGFSSICSFIVCFLCLLMVYK